VATKLFIILLCEKTTFLPFLCVRSEGAEEYGPELVSIYYSSLLKNFKGVALDPIYYGSRTLDRQPLDRHQLDRQPLDRHPLDRQINF
jgi:hypothetical protein